MTTEQMGLAEYIEVERADPPLCKWPSVSTSLYCRLSGFEIRRTARAEGCNDYIVERYLEDRVIRSCVFCRHSVNPKADPDFRIPPNENE